MALTVCQSNHFEVSVRSLSCSLSILSLASTIVGGWEAVVTNDESSNLQLANILFESHRQGSNGERSGSVVECLARDRRAAGSSLTGVTALCP